MSNISEKYRRPLMTDETGIAIAEKLDGDTASEYKINTSAEYRKPPMSDETAQLILAKMSGGASNLSDLDDVTLTNPSDGQVLHYDGSEWINATPVNELPAVTSSDNGSVLGVVEGAWAKMNVPQSVIFCTLTKSGTKYNLDKDWSTVVKPALDAGASLVVKYNYEGLGNVFFNLESYSNAGFNAIAFSGMAMSSDNSLLVIRLSHSVPVEEADFVLKGITLTAPW